jgi:GntR family transcriptional repressor for pyruvate dehydrogenase complex
MTTEGGTEQVVAHIRALIEAGRLRPGDRLPARRELAAHIGVSFPTLRAGLQTLAAMGVVRSRRGSGTFIPAGPPVLGSEALRFLAALHGFTRDEMYESRRILEVGAAGLAAERATPEQVAVLAEEVTELFVSMDDPARFLVHDITFHRAVAAGSGNPIIAAVIEMISELYYGQRRETARHASDRNLRDAAEMHRRVYQAIRARDPEAARLAMNEHLRQSSAHQAQEQDSASPAADSGSPERAAIVELVPSTT